MTPSEHVGMRVRMYRTKKKMTLDEFSRAIQKAPSTVSKYESGSIVIDINVIFEMAAVLGVTVEQLIDYHPDVPAAPSKVMGGNYFLRADLYYVYTLFAPSKTPYVCAMELKRENPDDSSGQLLFYFDVSSVNEYTNSAYLYNGTFTCFDHGTVFYLANPYNPSDVGIIYAKSPFSTGNTATGIFTFLPTKERNPCSTKVLFSTTPIPQPGQLIPRLSISDKDTISVIKRKNIFAVE